MFLPAEGMAPFDKDKSIADLVGDAQDKINGLRVLTGTAHVTNSLPYQRLKTVVELWSALFAYACDIRTAETGPGARSDGRVTAEEAYDTRECHVAIAAQGAYAVIPPE
ncbi:hypothetical protein [Sagittula sp. S175]|uniref:hypothetical protein n=1 Tax=Sagittula sp. S175 TaxID=3415129 RepID=UPI003C7E6969